ncbi:MAG: hypothetical protein U1E43_04045 [Rhodospirillales bacterium]
MAAHVEGESVLNYEHEEQAILQATQRLDLNLMVEESGCRGSSRSSIRPMAGPRSRRKSCCGRC